MAGILTATGRCYYAIRAEEETGRKQKQDIKEEGKGGAN